MTAALRLFGENEKRKKESWLAEFGAVWLQAYGGLMNFGVAARYLKPLVEMHGKQKVVEHFRHYLSQTEARYVSIARFAETFGAWNPRESKKRTGEKTDDQIAEKLRKWPLSVMLCIGRRRLQEKFSDVGFDGLTEREQAELIESYRKA